ncbi:MAG TPA: hypothetical protein VGM10_26110 [Actinocrinis sp.]
MPKPSEAGSPQAAQDLSDRTVRALAYAVVREVAPGELPYFDALLKAYLDDPDEALRPARRDSPGGSGFEAVLSPIAPIVVAAITGALTHELCEAVDALRKRLHDHRKRGTRRSRRKSLGGPGTVQEPVPATTEAGKTAAQLVTALSTELGLPTDRVKELCLRVEITVSGRPAREPGPPAPASEEAP